MKAREEMPLLRCALGPYGPPLRGRAALRNGIRNRWPQGHHNTELGHGRFHLKKADPWSENGGRRFGSLLKVISALEPPLQDGLSV